MGNRFMVWMALALLLLAGAGDVCAAAQYSAPERKLFRETKAKADKGDPQSEFLLGQFYARGTGVTADEGRAAKWHRKAAEHGLAQAQFQLGLDYLSGEGVKQNDAEALSWFERAAAQGLMEAELEVGRCYLTGKGTKENGTEAMKWFRKAGEHGSVAADYFIGKCYFDGTGVPRNVEEGVKWTERAAQAGFAPAEAAFGLCCERGTGVSQDVVQAYKWYALAAAQDDAHAPDLKVSLAKVEASMSKEQVAAAQRLAREFRPSTSKAPRERSSGQPGASLAPDTGALAVSSNAEAAEVFVDGGFVGNTPAKLNLKEGVHVVEVKSPGYKAYRREIKITVGADLNLRTVLEKD